MTYSIKQVSQITGLSIYTIRYYDKQGLLPFVKRDSSGYRAFTDADMSLIHTICCLKNTQMRIADIKQYIDYCMIGPESIEARKTLLLNHRAAVVKKQQALLEGLDEIDLKLSVYTDSNAKEIIGTMFTYLKEQ